MSAYQVSTTTSETQPSVQSYDIGQAITDHLPLVRKVARKTFRRFQGRFELDDLEGYGSLGLTIAAQRFDIRRGVPFEKFAFTYIWGSMAQGVSLMAVIRYKQFKALVKSGDKPVIGHCDSEVFDEVLVSHKDPAEIAAFKDDVEVKLAFLRSRNPVGAQIVKLRFQGKTTGQVASIMGLSKNRTNDFFQKSMRLLAAEYGFQYTPMTAGRRPLAIEAVAHV
jgi:DNA-directed RNA polymerase sigma subunit (sigma70/sigma32)